MQFDFIVCQVKGYRHMLKLSCRPLESALYKALSKTESGLELVSVSRFLHDF